MSKESAVPENARMDLQDIDVLSKTNEARVSPVHGFGSVGPLSGVDMKDKFNQFNPWTMLIMVGLLIIFFVMFDTLGVTNTSQQGSMPNKALSVLEIVMWGLFIFLLMINGLQYFFELDVKTAVVNLFSPEPRIDMQIDSKNIKVEEKEVSQSEEVFHIPGNKYTYKQANAVCKAFDAELANYSQIEEAYNGGGEWCSYGWSADQMALFPTQKVTWEKLQNKSKCGTNSDCGRPGVNGGYMANQNVRFGVNCYGIKPDETDKLKSLKNPFPKTKDEREVERLALKYKKQINKLKLSPFNRENWKRV